ncbi:hypothetical protein ABC383_02275 [Noviherbaspirillum sp. 1P10PC]|uniref:hypothetical protein n=1 Tax=Noviherbaspirillum sp. 1P10PC TaxID=3132292 RepID=UPI0039A332C1
METSRESVPAAGLLFCFAKKVTKKGDPMIAPRCAGFPCQRYPERGAAKLAKLRLTQTDAAPFPAPGTADTARSTGFHCHFKSNGNYNGNGNFKNNLNRRSNCNCTISPSPCRRPKKTGNHIMVTGKSA